MPVTFPPGLARLWTMPVPMMSMNPPAITIGTVLVTLRAASRFNGEPTVNITSTLRCTSCSASPGSHS